MKTNNTKKNRNDARDAKVNRNQKECKKVWKPTQTRTATIRHW